MKAACALLLGATLSLSTPAHAVTPHASPALPLFSLDQASSAPLSGFVTTGGDIDTVFYGGTVWAADSMRWEAIRGGKWGFGSGVGSALVGPGHTKPPTYHRLMEGWSGLDRTALLAGNDFRRTSECAITGGFSLHVGASQAEAQALCWPGGRGYGNNVNTRATRSFSYGGSGSITLAYQYQVDAEPGFDYLNVEIDTTGTGAADRVSLMAHTGIASGTGSIILTRGINMRSNAGPIVLYFIATSDGAYSDEDGLYDSACGHSSVDNIQLSGAIASLSTFEAGLDGWTLGAATPAAGDWSDLRALASLPPPLLTCPCDLQDSVLVFSNLAGGQPAGINNVAVSPWIDLRRGGDVGRVGRVVEYSGFFDQALQYRFLRVLVQYYPYTCAAGGAVGPSPFFGPGFEFFFSAPFCTPAGAPHRVNFSGIIPAEATAVRIALGVADACSFQSCATGSTTPWFDNARFGVYGTPNAPIVTLRTVDNFQDNFSSDGTRNPASTGAVDVRAINVSSVGPGTVLGDTLVALGDGGNTEVRLCFHVRPGPFTNVAALTAWANARWTSEPGIGPGWYSARMDTAESGSFHPAGRWMTALHESDPKFGGGTDSDRGGDGEAHQLSHDIFPDHILTPGARIDYFLKSRYLPPDPRNPGGSAWFITPDTTGRRYVEMEILPSSMAADTTWNCVLLVDRHADRDPQGQALIEQALTGTLGTGSANAEGTRYDRFDMNSVGSGLDWVARPPSTTFGASLTQLNSYQAVAWHTGSLNGFPMTEWDGQLLSSWLTGTPGRRFWSSGDDLASRIEAEARPSAVAFLHDVCGVSSTCSTVRNANCPTGTISDAGLCLPLGAVGGAYFTVANPGKVRGNGCPGLRSFDLLGARPAVPTARGQMNYVKSGSPVSFASVTNERTDSGFNYRTVVDGFSVAYQRDDTGGPATACTSTFPVGRRTQGVLDWFRGGLPYDLCGPLGISDAGPDPVGPPPVVATHLNPPAPNPMQGAVRITYSIGQDHVSARLLVFDVTGRLVRSLVDQTLDRGHHEATWNGLDEHGRTVPAGLYFVRLSAGGAVESRKLLLNR